MNDTISVNWKDDGVRSIADKIVTRLHDLDKTVLTNHGRWIWELLQNAKDSVAESGRTVSVQVELNEENVIFRHNGDHFNEWDIRGLIDQISSKEAEEGIKRNKTGRFGTGFLITHVLSRIVNVSGIIESNSGDYFKFNFPLDRDAKTKTALVPKIEESWNAFHKSTKNNKITSFNKEKYNTSFKYLFKTIAKKKIATTGILEFERLLPFVLAHIPEIATVEIINNVSKKNIKYVNNQEFEEDIVLKLHKYENGRKKILRLLFKKHDEISIGTFIEKSSTGYVIKTIEDVPKLFCDFPLIGTESFHFPVIVNSFNFCPLTEREGIWLLGDEDQEVDENKRILEDALYLFEELLSEIEELNCSDLFNLCVTKLPATNDNYFDKDWYNSVIRNKLKEIISNSRVVETEDSEKVTFNEVRFPDPDLKKDDREKAWQFSRDLKVNTLPSKAHIHRWAEIIWSTCPRVDTSDLITDFKGKSNIHEFGKELNVGIDEAFKWVNSFISFIFKKEGLEVFNENELIPNQEGTFCKRKSIFKDSIGDEELKSIALLLEYNYYEDLIDKRIKFDEPFGSISIQDVATTITESIQNSDNYERNALVEAIRRLTAWFEKNENDGRKYFQKLFAERAKLFMETIEDKENLFQVMRSSVTMEKLAEIATAIEQDPELLKIIENRRQELIEEHERNLLGEKIEKLLANALRQRGFDVNKTIVGKDLIVTLKSKNATYALEIKSTKRDSPVSMTKTQAQTAIQSADNYALCVVKREKVTMNVEDVKKHSYFITSIGKLLKTKAKQIDEIEKKQLQISGTNEDIDILIERSMNYKFRVSNKIWQNGIRFNEFIDFISSK